MGLGRRAVDLVGQDQIGEQRPLQEAKHPLARGVVLFEHVAAGDVGGHQVGRELDAVERQVHQRGHLRDEQRLGQPGHALQNAVPAAEDADHQLLGDVGHPDDDAGELVAHSLVLGVDLLDDAGHLVGRGMFGQNLFVHGGHATSRIRMLKDPATRQAISTSTGRFPLISLQAACAPGRARTQRPGAFTGDSLPRCRS